MGKRADDTEFDEMSVISEPEEDPLPENCFYRDEGCNLAESCLNCPFDECFYDRYENNQARKMAERAKEITKLFTVENKEVREIAQQYGLSKRTVFRDLKTVLGDRNIRRKDHGKQV